MSTATTTEKIKDKFTSTVVTEADKAYIKELREKTNLTEKDLMTQIIDLARHNEEAIIAASQTITEAKKAAAKVKKTERYEKFKAAMKVARAAMKVAANDTTAATTDSATSQG